MKGTGILFNIARKPEQGSLVQVSEMLLIYEKLGYFMTKKLIISLTEKCLIYFSALWPYPMETLPWCFPTNGFRKTKHFHLFACAVISVTVFPPATPGNKRLAALKLILNDEATARVAPLSCMSITFNDSFVRLSLTTFDGNVISS